MHLDTRPVTLVPLRSGWARSAHKPARVDLDRRAVVVYTPDGASRGIEIAPTIGRGPGMQGLGFIDALIGGAANIVGSLIGGDQQAKSEKRQLNAQLALRRMELDAAREAAKMQVEAVRTRASYDYQVAALEADNAAGAMRLQRFAAIDAQGSQLVANTTNGIFSLASTGIVESAGATQAWQNSAKWGAVLLVTAFLVAMNPPKFGKRKAAIAPPPPKREPPPPETKP